MKKLYISHWFLTWALMALLLTSFFGVIAGFQYLYPTTFQSYLPFYKTRPLHVFFVVSWIILTLSSAIYFYISNEGEQLYSEKLANNHFILFIFVALSIITCYIFGIFGGREYFAFPPILAIPIILGWLFFGINFFKSLSKKVSDWPVYYWMWSTGIIFFALTFLESYLWLIPYFRDNLIRDITVQWKAFGALVGSLNMLMYGTSIFMMCRIQNNEETAFGFRAFFFYFIGLTNLMFGWGHHSYILPFQPWIRHIAYFISMTELIILGVIIWEWKKTTHSAQKYSFLLSYRFLLASEVWIFLNLILAILISIPAVNYYTHGTYITVAHTMGTTIGINTNILLAFVFYFARSELPHLIEKYTSFITRGLFLLQFSLLFFWLSLIVGGIKRSYWMYLSQDKISAFGHMQIETRPYLMMFALAGIGIFLAILSIVIPTLKSLLNTLKSKSTQF